MLSFKTTMIQPLTDPYLLQKGVRVYVKREDQLHEGLSGNKWHKLKYNLQAAKAGGYQQVLSFGGAYSNHLHALALACQQLDMACVGVVRGDELSKKPLNPTLSEAQACGMVLHFLSRDHYRLKETAVILDELASRFGRFYTVPEGGANKAGMGGCADLWCKSCYKRITKPWLLMKW